jgi:pimeloyl-ACP methyl ester carboxylesterase
MQGADRLRSMSIDGDEQFYFDEGEPTLGTVVLLHGFPDTPRSYGEVASLLVTQGYRVVRPYLPGYAPSQWRGAFDVASLSQCISEFVENLKAGPVLLVGHDWGALLAYATLHRRPDLFRCALTISVPHPRFLVQPKNATLSQIYQSSYILLFQLPLLPEALARFAGAQMIAKLWRQWSPSYRATRQELSVIETCIVASKNAPFGYYRKLLPSLLARPDNYGEIEVPLLYLHGEKDGCIDASYAHGQGEYFRSAFEVEIVREVGHFPQVEQPTLLAQRIASWFQEHPERA